MTELYFKNVLTRLLHSMYALICSDHFSNVHLIMLCGSLFKCLVTDSWMWQEMRIEVLLEIQGTKVWIDSLSDKQEFGSLIIEELVWFSENVISKSAIPLFVHPSIALQVTGKSQVFALQSLIKSWVSALCAKFNARVIICKADLHKLWMIFVLVTFQRICIIWWNMNIWLQLNICIRFVIFGLGKVSALWVKGSKLVSKSKSRLDFWLCQVKSKSANLWFESSLRHATKDQPLGTLRRTHSLIPDHLTCMSLDRGGKL